MITNVKLLSPSLLARCEGISEANFKPGLNLLVGPNGSGKSTFLNAIQQQVMQDSGQKPIASVTRDQDVPLIFHSSETASGFAAEQLNLNTTAVVSGLGHNYMSFGQRLLSLLAELQNIREPRVILLDEPELALDFNAVNAFCGMMIKQAPTQQFIVSSHHPLMLLMPNVNFVVFGGDPKYPKNALNRLRKVLANSKL